MKGLRMIFIITLLVSFAGFTACERDYESSIISRTPPSLQVVVADANGAPVQNAEVKLYNDEATWDAEGAAVATKQTNADGKAEFSQEELKDPGFFYIIASDGALKVKAKTKYMLLTDGRTVFTVALK